MGGRCRFFDLGSYPEESEGWTEWDWPEKVWQRVAAKPLDELFETESETREALALPDRMPLDTTPSTVVEETDTTVREFVAAWTATLEHVPDRCPHDAADGIDYCVFHRPPGHQQEAGVTERIVSGAVTSVVGGNFETLDIQDMIVEADDSRTLRLDFCTVESVLLQKAVLEQNLSLRYATVGEFVFDHAHFEGDFDISYTEVTRCLSGSHAVFRGQAYGVGATIAPEDAIDLRETIFHRYCCFDRATFHSALEVWNAVFHADSEFRFADFHGPLNARWVDFHRFPDFHGGTFRDEADFGGTTFYDDAGFSEIEFHDDAHFQTDYNAFEEYAAIFHGVADFTHSEFDGEFNLRETEFKKYASFRHVDVAGTLVLWNAEFDEDADFFDATFQSDVDFRWSKFHGYGDFNETTFLDLANFGGVRFNDDVGFSDATFDATVRFRGEFSGYEEYKSHCHGIVDFGDATFREPLTLHAIFHDDVSFADTAFRDDVEIVAQFKGDADFSRVSFDERVDFHDTEFRGDAIFEATASADTVDMSGVTIRAGVIAQPAESVTHYDLTEATVGDIILEPKADPNLFDYFRFYETDFDGFDFPLHGPALLGNWRLHEFDGGSQNLTKSALINTYLKAKNGAHDVGAQTASAEFFMREMRFRRKKHWDGLFSGGAIARVLAGSRWLSNWFLNLSCGYGERPIRTITTSLVLILLFSGVYLFAGLAVDESPLAYLLFSIQAFVTLIFGETPQVDSILIQFIASFQGFVGAFFIALFVFALTRSIHR